MSEKARLVLVTPAPVEAAGWPGALVLALEAALDGGPIDAVVIRLPQTDERTLLKLVKPVVAAVQARNAAALLEDAPALVARAGADGVHLSGPEGLEEALTALKPHDRIVGLGGLRARHDAMEAAEDGVDYVMFGEPRPDGSAPPFSAVHERAQWWAEVFQTPCVAFAVSLEDVGPLAETGCEFVALGAAVFDHAGGPGEAVRQALAAIESAPVPVR